MNHHTFIFICGLHRSGTSLLYKSLKEHSEISGFQETGVPEDEGMHLQSVFKASGSYGGAGAFGFKDDARLDEFSPLISTANKIKLFNEWSPYWDLSKRYLLEKSPPNLIRTRFLQEMFPDTYFIVVIRHPIAVTYATRRWYKTCGIYTRSFASILNHWVVTHETFINDLEFLNKVLVIKYEKFVSKPHKTFKNIYSFLNLSYQSCNEKVHPNVNKRYFSMWQRDINSMFSKSRMKSLISNYEDRINSLGYSLINIR